MKLKEILLAIGIIIFLILIWKSQQTRLDEYSKWYCREIYGLTEDCQEK